MLLYDPQLYAPCIRPIVAETIGKYGEDEWKAAVLTCTMHGHIGIYAILGVKMGMRALEYLQTKQGSVQIHSFAGDVPPASCLNDGLQVSTGATFGHGLIVSPQTETPFVKAVFKEIDADRQISLQLKDKVNAMIVKEVADAVEKYAHSPAYWECVQNLALTCWRDLNRMDLFDISEE